MSFECGRSIMCAECVDLDRVSQKDVCIAVGAVSMMPDAHILSKEAIKGLTYHIMAGIVDDDDYVTPQMQEAAVESAHELITK
jgi:hypothetical protein